MSEKATEAPRGDAAWRAQRQEIADRNEAAYARARDARNARDADALKRRRDEDRRDAGNRPKQPGKH